MSTRTIPELSTGAMSDIAFLLLIFFVTTTEIFDEQGFQVVLPHAEARSSPARDTEIFHIYINSKNEILADKQLVDLRGMRKVLEQSIGAAKLRQHQKFVISLNTDRETSYEKFISVHEMIRSTYRDVWDDIAKKEFHRRYETLSDAEKNQVRERFPLVISEAEWVK